MPSKKTSRPSTPAVQLPPSACDTRKIPNDTLKNIRGAVLLAAIAEVYQSKITNTEAKYIEMEKNFFGAEESNVASLLKKMTQGAGAFAALFDMHPTPAGHDLYLRDHFTGGLGMWICGKHFDEIVLSRSALKTKTSARAIGRTLYDNASDVILCNCKKAMSLLPKLAPKVVTLGDDNSVVGYASGEKEEDFLRYVNDGMYAMLTEQAPADPMPDLPVPDDPNYEEGNESVNGENLTSTELSEELNRGDNEGETDSFDLTEGHVPDKDFVPFGVVAPPDYRFPGYFAFACFGPTRGVYYSSLLNPKGNSKDSLEVGKKTSRVAQREEEAKRQKYERGYNPSRGFGMETKVQLASVAQSDEAASMRQREARIAAIVSIIASNEKTRDCKMQLLSHVDNKQQLLTQIDNINESIDSLNNELKELSEEKRERSKIVKAVMKEAEESMGLGIDDNYSADSN